MKALLIAMSLVCFLLVFVTGNPSYLITGAMALVCWVFIFALDLYDARHRNGHE